MAITKLEIAQFITTEIGRLTRFVRRRMQGVEMIEPEDVVQDVALRLFALADISRPMENLAAYVFSALQNRITDLWRLRGRRPETVSGAGELDQLLIAAQEGNPSNDPATLAERSERLQLIAMAMESLAADERAVVIANEIEGRSFRELADEWDTPIGTLLARKHRAMQKLRTLLEVTQNRKGGTP
ncbi:MAG: sigma-70 family RNA polymerase sigma factor [Candidatus Aminicenantes bacterium]|nr:sigma-70 family RNA polymerase sigma factor [Candidatus Aminicenantes bacterium]